MDGLIFDDPNLNNEAPAEQPSVEAQQGAIDFSNALIGLLSDVTGKNKKVSLSELKQVYMEAGRNIPEDYKDANLWALAKVNMFVRMKSKKEIKTGSQEPKKLKKMTKLEFETEDLKIIDGKEINATKYWIPLDKDFDLAKSYIKKYDLTFSFASVNDLYIENEESLQLNWE